MSDTLITVIAIALAAVLMFVFPLMTMSDRTDDVSQLAVETTTTDFVEEVTTTRTITPDTYNTFTENIGSTGNTYNVEMQVQVLDENPGKKTLTLQSDKIGENAYYSVYTSQIEEVLNNNKNYNLKEGDMFSVSVKNTNQTLAQQLKNLYCSWK